MRLEHDRAVAELAAAAGLLLVARVRPRLLADRLEVRHARLVQLDLGAEAALDPLDGDLDVHLREPCEELLAGLLVAAEHERRVLLDQAAQRGDDLVLVALRLRRDREAHDRRRESERGRLGRLVLREEQVGGRRLLQLRHGADVAGREAVDGRVVLPLEEQQLAQALLPVRAPVDENRVRLHLAGEDAEDRDAPGERVGERLEHERGVRHRRARRSRAASWPATGRPRRSGRAARSSPGSSSRSRR